MVCSLQPAQGLQPARQLDSLAARKVAKCLQHIINIFNSQPTGVQVSTRIKRFHHTILTIFFIGRTLQFVLIPSYNHWFLYIYLLLLFTFFNLQFIYLIINFTINFCIFHGFHYFLLDELSWVRSQLWRFFWNQTTMYCTIINSTKFFYSSSVPGQAGTSSANQYLASSTWFLYSA